MTWLWGLTRFTTLPSTLGAGGGTGTLYTGGGRLYTTTYVTGGTGETQVRQVHFIGSVVFIWTLKGEAGGGAVLVIQAWSMNTKTRWSQDHRRGMMIDEKVNLSMKCGPIRLNLLLQRHSLPVLACHFVVTHWERYPRRLSVLLFFDSWF